MATLLLAVFMASLLGSFHCACMCGPIAIWSSGVTTAAASSSLTDRLGLAKRIAAYHFGRLFTYIVLGAIAGLAGKTIGLVGEGAGIQSASARLAGGLMIVIGLMKLRSLTTSQSQSKGGPRILDRVSQKIAQTIAGLRPRIAKLPVTARSVGIGAITVLLPCGWLYLFVLFAAGIGSALSAIGIMIAFWIGTIPSLVAMVTGSMQLKKASRHALPQFMPAIGAMVLILFGAHTATGRASADLKQLESSVEKVLVDRKDSPTTALQVIQSQPLPCCKHVK